MAAANTPTTAANSLRVVLRKHLRSSLHVLLAATLFGFVPAIIFIRHLDVCAFLRVPLMMLAVFYFPGVSFGTTLAASVLLIALRQFHALETLLTNITTVVATRLKNSEVVALAEVMESLNARADAVLKEPGCGGGVRWVSKMLMKLAVGGLKRVARKRFGEVEIGHGVGIKTDIVMGMLGGGLVKGALGPVRNTLRVYLGVVLMCGGVAIGGVLWGVGVGRRGYM